MIDGTYKKVIYYNLPALWNAGGGVPLTVDTSGYRWPKAFAVRIGTDTDLGPACPTISATYYTSAGSELTLTQQISTTSTTIPNSAQSIFGSSTTSGFSGIVIPDNSTWGHTLCKGSDGPSSWLWYPYRLVKLAYHAPTNGVPADSGLLLLF